MAKKSASEKLAQKTKNAAKRESKKVARRAAKNAAKDIKKEWKSASQPSGKGARRRKTSNKVIPYVMLFVSLILALCFFIVHILGLEDGVGAVGYWIQSLVGGFLGGASPLYILLMGFMSVRWCVYNVKWREAYMVPSHDRYGEYKRAKRHLILQGVLAICITLITSTMFAVVMDYSSYEFGSMWSDGANFVFEGGGIIGGTFGYLMLLAFDVFISMVILSIVLAILVIFFLGLTPDVIVERIMLAREKSRARKAALAAEEAAAEEQRRLQEKKNPRIAAEVKPVAAISEPEPSRKKKGKASMSTDELMAESEDSEPDVYIGPVQTNIPLETLQEKPAPSDAPVNEKNKKDEKPAEVGKDYGGETGFDPDEFNTLDDFFKALKANTVEGNAPDSSRKNGERGEMKPLDMTELESEELLSDVAEVTPEEGEEEEIEEPAVPYVFPPMDMLAKNKSSGTEDYTAELQENARQLVSTLKSFKISIKEINYSRGPTITRYELRPDAGVRVRSIANLVDDIALSLATSGVRIEAPIPGKPAVGIEVPNRNRATVYLRDLIDNPQFSDAKSKLTACLGMDVGGNPIYFDISKMPHMIIAGATGMGKSVCINCLIISILYKARPQDVKLILIDPKKVEFNLYKDIPHLYAPIVSEPKKAAGALASAVAEMERRFELIEEVGVRDIASYNAATENDPYKEHMPHMVIIIDELADLMMTAPDEVEASICRLAQKARAAGIHIIIGTQRPSVDVITGLIKANIPSRIACTVASQVDSRTIIDIAGAEKLIGRGDMLFAPVGSAKPLRVQGAFVTENEVDSICTFIRENNSKAKYNSEFINRIEEEAGKVGAGKKGQSGDAMPMDAGEGGDSKFQAAVKLAVEEGKISTSLMQRRLGVGYGRAAKIIDTMEEMGYVSKPDGNKPRRVLITMDEYLNRVNNNSLGEE